jgi:hypothetical protein
MNFNPGRGAIDYAAEAQSSPVRNRGYIAPTITFSPLQHLSQSNPHPSEQINEDESTEDESDAYTPPDGYDEKACRRQNGNFQQMLRFLEQRRGYTLDDFIRDCIHFGDVSNLSISTRRRRQILTAISPAASRRLLNEASDIKKGPLTIVSTSKSIGPDIVKLISQELDTLEGRNSFGKWSSEVNKTFDTIDISEVVSDIRQRCPTWHRILTSVARHKRTRWKSSYQKRDEHTHRIAYIITAMVMYQRASHTANFASTQLGMFLRSTGTKDRTIEVLSRFGICPTVATMRKKEAEIKQLARV